ncbi:MAG: helix-turn-helix domain-containing protein [Clostridiales bacterium]|nr:helix-turn-helix domain-containing protein [Clostridiales bacterium]
MAERFSLPPASCVVVLRPEEPPHRALTEIIRELAPLEENDLLAEDGAGRALMIKAGEDPEETAEFAMAVIGTIEGETGIRLRAGISDVHRAPEEWPAGYREALEALEIGERYRRKKPVQVYGHQMLERMVERIPPEIRSDLRGQVFGPHPERILTEEMRETAEGFFDADLNLSVAARQMFIHRNTLTYRLDRIQRETGLNLRAFRDAVIFRLLMTEPDGK